MDCNMKSPTRIQTMKRPMRTTFLEKMMTPKSMMMTVMTEAGKMTYTLSKILSMTLQMTMMTRTS